MISRYLFYAITFMVLLVGKAQYASISQVGHTRFAVVELSLRLTALPKPLNITAIDQFILASEVFLESSLNVPPVAIVNVQVAISSQQVGHPPVVTKGIDDSEMLLYHIITNLQILLEYQIPPDEAESFGGMEIKMKTEFSENWFELLSLLRLLDPTYFSSLDTIELVSPSQRSEPAKDDATSKLGSNLPSVSILLFFIVVGIGVILSCALVLPLVMKERKDDKSQMCSRKKQIFKESSETAINCDEELRYPTRKSSNTSSLPEIKSGSSTSDVYIKESLNATGCVQKVYSDDKVSESLSGLRVQKANSEDKLKQRLKAVLCASRDHNSQEQNVDKLANQTSLRKVEQSGDGISRVSTGSTDNPSDQDDSGQDCEASASVEEGKIEPPTDDSSGIILSPTFASQSSYLSRPLYVSATNTSKGDHSVSTLSGDVESSCGSRSNDEEAESLEFGGGDCSNEDSMLSAGLVSSTPSGMMSSHVLYPSAADDFGSIAKSLPISEADQSLYSL